MDTSLSLYLPPILLYLGGTVGLVIAELRDRPALRNIGLLLVGAGIILHAVAVGRSVALPPGWDANFLNLLSLTALLIMITLLVTAVATRTVEACIIAAPGAALCLALQYLVPIEPLILDQLTTPLRLHIISSLMAYSVLSIAAINALMLAAQDHALRHPVVYRKLDFLPPLVVIESIMFRLIGAGWLLLTLSLASGLVFVDNLFAQHLAHKTALSFLSWLLFGLLLFGRIRLGWRGRKAVRWTLIAMAVLVLAYFGSKLVLEVLLDRSWRISRV